jgi:hypothetical protein
MFVFIIAIVVVVALCTFFPRSANTFFVVIAMPSVGAIFGGFVWCIAAIMFSALINPAAAIFFVIMGIIAAEVWYFKSQ